MRHVAGRIREVQDILERTMLIENVSSYMAFRASRLTEWEFLGAVAEEADCAILLDINNIFVSAFNHRFDPRATSKPFPRIAWCSSISLAIATTAAICSTPTTIRFARGVGAVRKGGATLRPVPTLIEWDDNIPEFEVWRLPPTRRAGRCEFVLAAAEGKKPARPRHTNRL